MSTKALELLRRLVEKGGADAQSLLELAELELEHGHRVEAMARARQAHSLDGDAPDARLLLARMLIEDGQATEAETVLGKVTTGHEARYWHLKSRIKLHDDDRAGAEDAYFRAVEADPKTEDENFLQKIRVPFQQESEDGGAPPSMAVPRVSFADVAGMEDLKQVLKMSIILPMRKPEIFAAYKKKIGGGILMYGPPGCGKTHVAMAAAGEAGVPFFYVGLHEILDMWLGESERKLHAVFEAARRAAPSIILLDEIDAIGGQRSKAARSMNSLTNQLLQEMERLLREDARVLVIGATNMPWGVDGALRRPGRFDHVVFVPPPDRSAREAILRLKLKGRPTGKVDHPKIAKAMAGRSAADMTGLVERASDEAVAEAMKTEKIVEIDTAMLLRAASQIHPTVEEWMATALDHARYSNSGGAYDPILAYDRKSKDA